MEQFTNNVSHYTLPDTDTYMNPKYPLQHRVQLIIDNKIVATVYKQAIWNAAALPNIEEYIFPLDSVAVARLCLNSSS
jgi:hypothetical protein